MSHAIDTETTGVDLRHGAKPFFVTICNEEGEVTYWEWDVDPLTREPKIPQADIQELKSFIAQVKNWSKFDDEVVDRHKIVMHNGKFDVTSLSTIGVTEGADWPWSMTEDTLIMGHLLASNHRHDLTSMALEYLAWDIQPLENALNKACQEARRYCRAKLPEWKLAREGLEGMPSAKGGSDKTGRGAESERPWKFDCWLPRALAKHLGYEEDHPWWRVLAEYSNADSTTTIMLWKRMRQLVKERKLEKIYRERMRLLPIAWTMESRGVTLSKQRLNAQRSQYREESYEAGEVCRGIARSFGVDLELPKAGVNNSLQSFCFDSLKLPTVKASKKTGKPSLDKSALSGYLSTLPQKGKAYTFVKNLVAKRTRDIAVQYMDGYERFWKQLLGHEDWYVLHPSLNPTGTDTLRWSSSNPNEQNISKREGFNLRNSFGPAPGREWWSCDAQNIELRLPAYEAGEQAMIDLFEKPDEPPYYGSNHLLVSHVLHRQLFEQCVNDKGEIDGRIFKKKYASTWYQWVKNGNFAVQYGAQEASGTADRAYHVAGAQAIIMDRFKEIKKLNERWIAFAEKHGYVETIPDTSVDPTRGYPLLCTRTEWGRILPTVPLSYHIQSTAMWWTARAMVRCQEQLDNWREEDGFDGFITLQVHDEMVFDFPKGEGDRPWETNLWRIKVLQKLMEQGGRDIGVPTPTSREYHAETWAVGMSV